MRTTLLTPQSKKERDKTCIWLTSADLAIRLNAKIHERLQNVISERSFNTVVISRPLTKGEQKILDF